jgi:hypothetical protein
VIDRDDSSRPARQFGCETSTAKDRNSYSPEPHWTVSAAPLPPAGADRVVAIGDSVTAGFGYCGIEGGANSEGINCDLNGSMANHWASLPGQFNSLNECQPVDPPTVVNDRCSNNNDRGNPWDAGPWFNDNRAPTISYPYVIAKAQRTTNQAYVEDWAMTGSTPVDWDPTASRTKDDPTAGAFAPQLQKIHDSYVLMTLGANPLLSDYLRIDIAAPFKQVVGKCADSTLIRKQVRDSDIYLAAPLSYDAANGKDGLFHCFDDEWNRIHQSEHLVNVYKALLRNGNHVLVLGYPAVCPWSFGRWDPQANVILGPAQGHPCTSRIVTHQVWPGGRGDLSQWDQAKALGARANDRIADAARQAGSETGQPNDIRFALPDQGAWSDHQAWTGNSWIFKNDTWIHPSVEGHQQLAKTAMRAMCDAWRRWCGDPPSWK